MTDRNTKSSGEGCGGQPAMAALEVGAGAQLTEAETQALIDGLKQSVTNDSPLERQGEPPGG